MPSEFSAARLATAQITPAPDRAVAWLQRVYGIGRRPVHQQGRSRSDRGSWVGLAVFIAVAIILYAVHAPVLGAGYDAGPVGMLLALPGSLAVVLSRYNPQAAVGLVLLGTAAIGLVCRWDAAVPFPWTVPSMLALFWCFLLVGWSVSLSQAALTWSMTIGLSIVLELVVRGGLSDAFFVVLSLSLLMTLVGTGAKLIRASEARADQQAEIGAQERERRQLLEEKAKIARELHDVVAHHMSVISVQAATAEYRIDGLGPQVREEFRTISEQSRSSLVELRRVLGVLRGDAESLQLAPQPGVADLGRVIEHVTRAGVAVDLRTDDLSELDEAVSIATYRIVQEALSNVVRHAPGAPAQVVIERSTGAVEVTVTNPASSHPGQALSGAGHGLRGMRERAAALGGTLSAGPSADGGFEVRAWLPVQPVDQRPHGNSVEYGEDR